MLYGENRNILYPCPFNGNGECGNFFLQNATYFLDTNSITVTKLRHLDTFHRLVKNIILPLLIWAFTNPLKADHMKANAMLACYP